MKNNFKVKINKQWLEIKRNNVPLEAIIDVDPH